MRQLPVAQRHSEWATPAVAIVRTLPPNTNSMHHVEVPPLDVQQEGKLRDLWQGDRRLQLSL
jgi:hypothetical protein